MGPGVPAFNQAQEPLPGPPPELAKLMAELIRLNGGRIPRSMKEVDRILARHPEVLQKFVPFMANSGLEDDEFLDLEEEPPSRPFQPPSGRRGKKKKKRRR